MSNDLILLILCLENGHLLKTLIFVAVVLLFCLLFAIVFALSDGIACLPCLRTRLYSACYTPGT